MIEFKYMVRNGDEFHYFKNLADAWFYADKNGLERPPRIKDKDNTHPYMRGPLYWFNNLRFWHNVEVGKMKYSKKAKEYYDNWLQDQFSKERDQTRLQDKIGG